MDINYIKSHEIAFKVLILTIFKVLLVILPRGLGIFKVLFHNFYFLFFTFAENRRRLQDFSSSVVGLLCGGTGYLIAKRAK